MSIDPIVHTLYIVIIIWQPCIFFAIIVVDQSARDFLISFAFLAHSILFTFDSDCRLFDYCLTAYYPQLALKGRWRGGRRVVDLLNRVADNSEHCCNCLFQRVRKVGFQRVMRQEEGGEQITSSSEIAVSQFRHHNRELLIRLSFYFGFAAEERL